LDFTCRADAGQGALRGRIKQHVGARLESFKVPVRILFSSDEAYGTGRFKKMRSAQG
jgi:hypothetical protein